MKNLTATELSRKLSDILDAVEHRGESFEITRNGSTVARLTPRKASTAAALLEFLRENPPDPEFAQDVKDARSLLLERDRNWLD